MCHYKYSWNKQYVYLPLGIKEKVYEAIDNMPPVANEDLGEASNLVEQNIKSNQIMIFSKSYCPFCNKVKQMFNDKGLAFTALELDTMGQLGANIQAALLQKTGQKTVPSVFFDGKHIGNIYSIITNSKIYNLR